jgi:hypothetical protein
VEVYSACGPWHPCRLRTIILPLSQSQTAPLLIHQFRHFVTYVIFLISVLEDNTEKRCPSTAPCSTKDFLRCRGKYKRELDSPRSSMLEHSNCWIHPYRPRRRFSAYSLRYEPSQLYYYISFASFRPHVLIKELCRNWSKTGALYMTLPL